MQDSNHPDKYALITGASLGIGRALAFECAKRNFNLFMVALPGPELSAACREIREKYPVNIHMLGIDLTHEDAPGKIQDRKSVV